MATAQILGSFAYFAKADMGDLTRKARTAGVDVDFMADSGAFTAYTTGKVITVAQYTAWLLAWAPYINSAMTLDVIGNPAGSARNTELLRDAVGDAVYVIPIFHVGSPWEELARWCSTSPYVALGGGVAVANREQQMMAWLVKCHKIAREHGAVLHGLGMTRPPMPELLPWYSVDSSFWSQGFRSGSLTLYDPDRRRMVNVRNTQALHRAVKLHSRLIRTYGGDPAAVSTKGFGMTSVRGTERGRAEVAWMEQAAIASWTAYGRHLAERHGAVKAPAGVTGDGPKIYLAAGSTNHFNRMVATATLKPVERMLR